MKTETKDQQAKGVSIEYPTCQECGGPILDDFLSYYCTHCSEGVALRRNARSGIYPGDDEYRERF